ncbi:MAG: hypothetical protein LBQ00_02735 [Syntrophobacterales bacterium]|nr:hypothetical protein [Syntrophobacterales bacterium]
MICEKCATESETVRCSHCNADVIKLGSYCYSCGKLLDSEGDETEHDDEIDLSTRILCSDEACIGVVNEEGVCKVCGKPYVQAAQE